MASLLQVEEKLAQLIEPIVYPDGTTNPSIVNKDVKIVIGFPVKSTLDTYLIADKVFISIYPIEKMDKNTTRYGKQWETTSINEATLFVVVDNNNLISITGVVEKEQTCVVNIDGEVYAYAVQAADTLDDIAQALGVQIPGAIVVSNTINVPGAIHVSGGVSVIGEAVKEVKRQAKLFCVTIWAPDVQDRDILGEAIDVYLSNIERFVLPDDVFARIVYNGTVDMDDLQNHRIFKRDLEYLVEYATTIVEKFNTIVTPKLILENNSV